MKESDDDQAELSREELKELRRLNRAVDDVLEESLKARENLEQTFRRLFPELMRLTGAVGCAVTTLDEELSEQTWHVGDFGSIFPGTVLKESRWGARRFGSGTFVSQALDVVGLNVGALGLLFEGDHTSSDEAARLCRALDA